MNRSSSMCTKENESKLLIIQQQDQNMNFLYQNEFDYEQAMRMRFKQFSDLFYQHSSLKDAKDVKLGQIWCINQNNQQSFYFDFYDGGPHQKIVLSLEQYVIYSGQVIAARFVQKFGVYTIEVKQIITDFSFIQDLAPFDQKYHQKTKEKSIIIYAGPFCSLKNIDYSDLKILLLNIKVKKIKCDLLILLGPLLDIKNEFILNNDVEINEIISHILKMIIYTNFGLQVIIVNSTQEFTEYNSIPQPPLKYSKQFLTEKEILIIEDQITFVGNPSLFKLQDLDLTIGVINSDIISDLYNNSQIRGIASQEKLSVILDQFLQQRTFVPIRPISDPVDNSKTAILDFNSIIPQILIVPSVLSPFQIMQRNTLFINPGYSQYAQIDFGGKSKNLQEVKFGNV